MVDKTDKAISKNSVSGIGYEPTYSGVTSLFRREYSKIVKHADLVTWGVTYDLSVTNRPGARFGPRAIREASTNLAWDGGPWPWKFDPFESIKMIDYGDCYFDPGFPEQIFENIKNEAKSIIDHDCFLLSMGGDHSVSYPLLKAHANKYGPLSLIQFDSHSDTWAEQTKRFDHGSMFYHASKEGIINTKNSVQIGLRTNNTQTHGFNILDASFVHENTISETCEQIRQIVGTNNCYLSFDIDFLDPAYAPGTGTPVCGGFTSWEAQSLIRGLNGINFVGGDLVEVSPSYDKGEITALAAASILLDFICLLKSENILPKK